MSGDRRNIISRGWPGTKQFWLIRRPTSRVNQPRPLGKPLAHPRFLLRAIIPAQVRKLIAAAAGTSQEMHSLSLIPMIRRTLEPATRERMMLALLIMSTLLGDPDYSIRNRRRILDFRLDVARVALGSPCIVKAKSMPR